MALTAQRIIDSLFFNQETDPTPIDQTYILLDHPSWDEPRKVLYPLTASDSGVLVGGNLITSSGWSFSGWSGNESIGWTHTAGNTTPLSNVLSAVSGTTYQIQLTVSNRTAGSFIAAFGGDTSPALISSAAYSLTATTNGNLTITPSSDFNGTILISIKEVVWALTKQEILDILGVSSIYGQAETDALLANKVDKVTGSSLISNTEIIRLLGVKQNIYTLLLAASSDVATRLVGLVAGTDYPTGWSLSADSGVNLLVTHTLTGRKIASVNVWEIDGSETLAKPFSDGFAQIIGNGMTVKIVGLDILAVALRIELIFN